MCYLIKTVGQGLFKIWELREAIHHQRRVNLQTYVQMTEIHLELQYLRSNGTFEANATLTRNAIKFAAAVQKFSMYLEKYSKKHSLYRAFKRTAMEEERLEIVAEIEHVFRMLGLATSATIMSDSATASRNASNFFSKLENVHKDVKLTHEDVIRALLQKRKNEKKVATAAAIVVNTPVVDTPPPSATDLNNLTVPAIMNMIASDGSIDEDNLLLPLLRKCVTNTTRLQVIQANGVYILSKLVRDSDSFVTQLYALHCLSWFTFFYGEMMASDFEMLRGCIRVAALSELVMLHNLLYGSDTDKEDALILCSCIATNGDEDGLREGGILPQLVGLLRIGTPNQKFWAAEALGTLAGNSIENCETIVRGGAIEPLIALLRTGTDLQKQNAVYTLGTIAAGNGSNCNTIAQKGAIAPLVELLRTGSSVQQQWAVFTLGHLAHNDENCVEMMLEGVTEPIIKLLVTGTDDQKLWACYTLGNLASADDTVDGLEGAITPLIEFVRAGTDSQKQEAAYTLALFSAQNGDYRSAITRQGGVDPLVVLAQSGTSSQKQVAIYALEFLAYEDTAVVEQEAIAPVQKQPAGFKEDTKLGSPVDIVAVAW